MPGMPGIGGMAGVGVSFIAGVESEFIPGTKEYDVEDHAFRLYRDMGGDITKLPEAFVTALEISAYDHLEMVAAVAPYIDSAVSKTVNVAADYPFDQFSDLYLRVHGIDPHAMSLALALGQDPAALPRQAGRLWSPLLTSPTSSTYAGRVDASA